MVFLSLGLGAIGGVARASVGLMKAMRSDMQIHWGYSLLTVFLSAIIGAAAGVLFDSDPKLTVVAGYIGTDLLEGAYKIVFKSTSLPVAS
jgi:hypothetical protein